MSLMSFFSPVNLSKLSPKEGFYSSQLGANIEINTSDLSDPENNQYDIALFGVADDRNAVNNQGCSLGPDHIR